MAAKTNAPLQDAAATAALYVTKAQAKPTHPLLDEDGKLSSASAATSLKYAKATDLPSFPSTGGVKLSSAGAAASLANSNQKDFEHWKPGALPAAEKAAFLARDYQADPLWQPELSQAGSKAAILAAQDGGNVEIWLPTESAYGQSAAGQAVSMKSTSPVVSKKVPEDAHRKALMAATGAMAGSRRRAGSMPTKPVDSDTPWALKAATASHRGATKESYVISDPAVEASRITHIAKGNVARAMYSANPPVSIEVEEKNRQDTLRASAVAMAQKMYAIQQTAIDQAKQDEQGLSHTGSRAAVKSHHRRMSTTSSIGSEDNVTSYPQYTNLQEAATRLAQERLSKLENEHKAYRDYYGQGSTPNRSRLSRTLRRRASSDGQLDKVDEEQSRKIRSQMSIFKSRVEEVDERKRSKDREALMAAAQKKVTANMSAMDEKVFNETGKASPAMMKQWEEKARQRAEADSATRMENYGKVDIGGGKFLDQAAVEAVARSRLQPTFDDITEKAEAQRARDEKLRLEQEERKRKADTEKLREAELKSAMKVAKDQEKDEERAKKAGEKRLHEQEKQEKRLTKEEKRKSKSETKHRSFGAILGLGGAKSENDDTQDTADVPGSVETAPVSVPTSEAEPAETSVPESNVTAPSTKQEDGTPFGVHAATTVPPVSSERPEVSSDRERPTSSSQPPPSPTKQSWFSRHFKRGSKSKSADGPGSFSSSGMAGRAASHSDSSLSDEDSRAETSMRDVAMAGRSTSDKQEKIPAAPTAADDDMYEASAGITSDKAHAHASASGRDHSPSISSLSDEAEVDAHHATTASASAEPSGNRRSIGGLKDRLMAKIHTKDSDNSSVNDDDAFEDTVEEHQGQTSMDASAPSSVTGTGAVDKGKGVSKFSENI